MLAAAAMPDPWTREMLAGSLADPAGGILGLRRCRVLLAFAAWRVAADEGELLDLAVHPRFRRRGLARLLLAETLHRMSGRGAARAFLEVRAGNRPALALYRSCGFREAGRRRGYYRDGEDALVMVADPLALPGLL